MITQIMSEKIEDIIELQLLLDDSVFPAVYYVLVTKNGEQIESIEAASETLAYGILDGFKRYYSSTIKKD